MYQQWASGRLDGAVVWTREVSASGARHRILPDGCLDLIWSSGTLIVAGPDTGAWMVESRPGTVYVGLRFGPGTGPAVLGVPAVELRDSRVELADLMRPAIVRRLAARLAAASDSAAGGLAAGGLAAGGPAARGPAAELESAAAQLLASRPDGRNDALGTPLAAALVAWPRAGGTVRAISERTGLSERQLHRRCLALFGYGPKTLARILRFDRSVAMARRGVPLARVAAANGYADQPHLSRDVRALAGVSLRTLLGS